MLVQRGIFRGVFFAIALVAEMASGCARHVATRSPPTTARSVTVAGATRPATGPTTSYWATGYFNRQSDDRNVLDTVFADLLVTHDSPLAARKQPPPSIWISWTWSTVLLTSDDVLLLQYAKKWADLPNDQRIAAEEAAGEFARRRLRRDGPPKSWPTDARVLLSEEAPPGHQGRFDHATTISCPGYSADGRFAVVLLGIPWSIHSADGVYLLERQDGGQWRILLRDFVYYL